MTTDLTVGKPSQKLFWFSIPLLLSVAFQQLYQMADSIIVGRFAETVEAGELALAAVGASSALTTIFICVAIGGGISKQPLLLDSLRRVYAGLFASRGESPYMIGLPRCEIVPCHFSSEANQVGALYTYLQAESKTI